MPDLPIDRFLETCYRNDGATEVRVEAGSQPLIRVNDDWRTLQTRRLLLEDVQRMAKELFGTERLSESKGCCIVDFWFGNVARFRAMAFGFPETTAMLLQRLKNPPAP